MTERDGLALLLERGFKEGRAEGLSIADCADVLAKVVREKLEDDDLPKDASAIWVQAVVSSSSGNALVQCRVGEQRWQWLPDEARTHALAVLTAAEAAVHDAAMVRWLTLEVGMDAEKATRGLLELRRFRGDSMPVDLLEGS